MSIYRRDFANQVDQHTEAFMTIDRIVTTNFRGLLFVFSHPFSLDKDGAREFLLTSAADSVHYHVFINSHASNQYEIDIYRDTEKTENASNLLTGSCRNFMADNTCDMSASHTPDGTGDGTLVYENHFGSAARRAQSGGALFEAQHWILDSGNSMLVRVTSKADENILGMDFHVVQHADSVNTYVTKKDFRT